MSTPRFDILPALTTSGVDADLRRGGALLVLLEVGGPEARSHVAWLLDPSATEEQQAKAQEYVDAAAARLFTRRRLDSPRSVLEYVKDTYGGEQPGHDWTMPHDSRAIEDTTAGCPPNCPRRLWAEARQ